MELVAYSSQRGKDTKIRQKRVTMQDKKRISAHEVKLEQQGDGEWTIKHKRLRGRWSAGVMATEFEECLWRQLQWCKAECTALKNELKIREGQNDRDREAEQEDQMSEKTA